MNDKIEITLYKLIQKAIKNDEVPVGAIIINKNNKIIAKAYNKVNKTNNILNHAEIICINKASKKIKNWRLNNCTMYVTLEPCSMCKEIIKKSRLNKVIYYSKQNDYLTENNPTFIYKENKLFSEKLKNFFKSKRK